MAIDAPVSRRIDASRSDTANSITGRTPQEFSKSWPFDRIAKALAKFSLKLLPESDYSFEFRVTPLDRY